MTDTSLPLCAKRPITKTQGTYPHPSFPGPDAPSIEGVTKAKKTALNIISNGSDCINTLNRINAKPGVNQTYVIYRVDKFGSPMLEDGITMYSLLSHEMVWNDLLSILLANVIGKGKANLKFIREADRTSILMEWIA